MSDIARKPIRRALVSVYDKTGLEELARALADAGVEIVSTGNSARTISSYGVPVTPIEQLTGFPECLDGRVKTLHPKVHAGLLADVRRDEHVKQLAELGVEPFDLLVSNLYPFRQTVTSGASFDECIEQIDIGGPAMVRSSAKNHANVAVVVSPELYPELIEAIAAGGTTAEQRQRYALGAFRHTASYDVAVAAWLGGQTEQGFPGWTGATWELATTLRYGENPHQQAALYTHWRPGLAHAEQLHGKEMSYNNYTDTDAAWRAAHDFTEPCVAIIKHANPCGIAIGADVADAYAKAQACDPLSAYGGVIAANTTVTEPMARHIAEASFAEVVAAPDFEPAAVEVLSNRWKNVRLLKVPAEAAPDPVEFHGISGGVLMQTVDRIDAPGDDPANWTLAAGEPADEATLADLAFAWRAIRAVKSNAILLAHDRATTGVGMGQVNRVDSARLAVQRAGAERAAASVGASDAFFPFPDGLEVLAEAGVRAVVEPGGSKRDPEAIAAAKAAGVTLYFTGTRHFFH
ncbi:bifunctional phosphoribosylaminoimidazolecarboxamide formyltransferase/IMP cyclohydrolase [Actinocatenispora comari]|uniref:Bifunctional purine biosynthesis protein PurH n=1 Tax=Actinocatenispora comari TaxID=2807577 RepID=A0A8J4ENE5_9ACTN|nr:bifunctional phosphoribosylaminoimidazolecarboxamide formyltransferase/IMP cyclohydrolase [Actinocatenispora comari]GIL27609.1 bifunctional purine biosynthesis protein PurH [Actinocatenispora comari]